MNASSLIKLNINANEKSAFVNEVIEKNIYRGKLLSIFIILTELILCAIDIFSSYNLKNTNFKFDNYFLMYLAMIIVNIVYLFFLFKIKLTEKNLVKVKGVLVSYIIFMMSWGAFISLMDQKLYGQIIAYMVNVIACSVIYYLNNKILLISYSISGLILFLGLPMFQESKNIIIGHYVNCIIFLLYAWLASRILYKNLYNDFKGKNLIAEANKKLEKETQENKIMREKLEKVNIKLKERSLKDDLTKVCNRRALRNFIDNIFVDFKQKIEVSIIMMDIDNFKLFNDKYGHVEGDEVLKKISIKLNGALRDSNDFVARYGGEEFVYIALNTDEKEIRKIASKIKAEVYQLKIVHGGSNVSKYVTLSIGTATVHATDKNAIYQGIKNADIALYKAKAEGKNRVENYKGMSYSFK